MNELFILDFVNTMEYKFSIEGHFKLSKVIIVMSP